MENGKNKMEPAANKRALLNKARDSFVRLVDQNNDGALDMKDVAAFADSIGNAAKDAIADAKQKAEERSLAAERKALQPIFLEDLNCADFVLPKLIRITEIDKRRAESRVCQGAIGFYSELKELKVVNIFRDTVGAFGLSFYPDTDGEIYYIDPSDRNKYIALDEYFSYLKVARINELQKIAQDLGAKHFRVTYKEFEGQTDKGTGKGNGSLKDAGVKLAANAEHVAASSVTSNIEVAAEMQCIGHAPIVPKLCYLQREPCIQSLISLRMDRNSPVLHQKYILKLGNSCGMKEKDAIKVDAALKTLKVAGGMTITSEARRESRRTFEYEIDF
jgi:hypothetical protein